MQNEFEPGDKVVCVKAPFYAGFYDWVGAVYTVLGVKGQNIYL